MARALDRAAFYNKVGYAPHKEQLLYHNSRARFRVPVCGRRFGKSTMAGHDLEPKLFLPKKMFWIVGPTYDLGEKEFRVIWDSLVIKMQMGKSKSFKKAYNKKQGNMFLEMPWGTRLEVRSADHPENLVGEALDGAIMSEAAKHKMETWERFIRPALTDRRGFADFPTTPEGFNWLHDLWQRGPDPKFSNWESWSFPSWANTVVYPGGRNDDEIREVEMTSAPEWFAQEYGADFASFVGKILTYWDERTHVRDVPFRPDLPNYMAIDFGFTNPFAAVEFQVEKVNGRERIRIWREHKQAFLTLQDHIRIMKNRDQPEGYRLDLAFGDPADPEGCATISRDLVPCIGDPAVKSDYTWREGIDLLNNFMRPLPPETLGGSLVVVDEWGTPADDEPGLIVSHDCPQTIREFNNYKSKEPVKGQNVPELGAKVDDHIIDAVRYGVVYIFKMGAISSLSDIYTQPNAWQQTPRLGQTNTPVTLSQPTPAIDPGLATVGTGFNTGGFGSMEGMEF